VGGCFVRVKLPGCETDHLPLTSAEAKNGGSFTSAPVYVVMTCRQILSVRRTDVAFQTSVAVVFKTLVCVVADTVEKCRRFLEPAVCQHLKVIMND
jgi:hypothetical protein